MNRPMMILATLAALALAAGCPKPDDGSTQEPRAGDTDVEPGRSGGAGESTAGSTADGTEPRSGPAGLAPSLEAAGVLPSSTRRRTHSPADPPAQPPSEVRHQVFGRMLVEIDVLSVLETPVWPMMRGQFEEELEPEQRCIVELLPQVQSIFLTADIGETDDLEAFVFSVQTTAGASAVEEAAVAGTAPGEDPDFRELTGPLGPAAIRVVALPGPDFVNGGPEVADTPPALACFVEAWPRMTGFGLGIGWRQGLDGALVVRHGSPEAAADTGACLESSWSAVAQGVRTGLESATDPRDLVLAGPAMEEMLGSFRVDVPGELVVARLRVPGQLLLALLARLAAQ